MRHPKKILDKNQNPYYLSLSWPWPYTFRQSYPQSITQSIIDLIETQSNTSIIQQHIIFSIWRIDSDTPNISEKPTLQWLLSPHRQSAITVHAALLLEDEDERSSPSSETLPLAFSYWWGAMESPNGMPWQRHLARVHPTNQPLLFPSSTPILPLPHRASWKRWNIFPWDRKLSLWTNNVYESV